MTVQKPLCFVIGPIGEKGSAARKLANWLAEGIVQPALEPLGYEVQRADKISTPGMITDQVIIATMQADLVVADLTGRNPNAFYELGIRHMAEKPVIHVVREGEAIPFDVHAYRAILYSTDEPANVETAKRDLAAAVKAITTPGYRVSNPVTAARGSQELAESADTRDQLMAEMRATLQSIEARVGTIENRQRSEHMKTGQGWLERALAIHPRDVVFREGALNQFERELRAQGRSRLHQITEALPSEPDSDESE